MGDCDCGDCDCGDCDCGNCDCDCNCFEGCFGGGCCGDGCCSDNGCNCVFCGFCCDSSSHGTTSTDGCFATAAGDCCEGWDESKRSKTAKNYGAFEINEYEEQQPTPDGYYTNQDPYSELDNIPVTTQPISETISHVEPQPVTSQPGPVSVPINLNV